MVLRDVAVARPESGDVADPVRHAAVDEDHIPWAVLCTVWCNVGRVNVFVVGTTGDSDPGTKASALR